MSIKKIGPHSISQVLQHLDREGIDRLLGLLKGLDGVGTILLTSQAYGARAFVGQRTLLR